MLRNPYYTAPSMMLPVAEATPGPIFTALESLRSAALNSKKPESDILAIINSAIEEIKSGTDPIPEPATPDARAKEIMRVVNSAGAPDYLASFYISGKKSVSAIKAELLPYLTANKGIR